MKARRRNRENLPDELVRILDTAGPSRVIPGLEALGPRPVPSRPVDPCTTHAVSKRGRRAPAIPLPVDVPPKSKRGRRT